MRKPGMMALPALCVALLVSGCDGSASPAANSSSPLAFGVATADVAPRPDTHTTSAARLLASNVLDWPVGGGNYIFWVAAYNGGKAIYGFSPTQQTDFLVTDKFKTNASYTLVSDGQLLAWSESVITDENSNPAYSFYGYNLVSKHQFPITLGIDPNPVSLALDEGQLFYNDYSVAHFGLYDHDLASGQEQLISRCGDWPVVAEGVLIWGEPEDGCSGQPPSSDGSCCYLPQKTVLHLLKLDGSEGDTPIAVSAGNVRYAVAGKYVTWAVYSDDQPANYEGVFLYDLGSGNSKRISAQVGYDPLISDSKVVWNNHPTAQSPAWTISSYDIQSGATSLVVKESASWSQARAIIRQNQLVYSMTPSNGGSKIYLDTLP